jgi:urease accessory protein
MAPHFHADGTNHVHEAEHVHDHQHA